MASTPQSLDEARRTVTLLLKLAERVEDQAIQRIVLEAGHRIADLALSARPTDAARPQLRAS